MDKLWNKLPGWAQPVVGVSALLIACTAMFFIWKTYVAEDTSPSGDDTSIEETHNNHSPAPKTPQKPELPKLATENTAEGAKAFVKHYIATINYANASGDTAPMRALANKELCKLCIGIADSIDHDVREGLRMEGGKYEVTEIVAGLSDEGYAVPFRLVQESAMYRNKAGKLERPLDGGDGENILVVGRLKWHGNGVWSLESMDVQND